MPYACLLLLALLLGASPAVAAPAAGRWVAPLDSFVVRAAFSPPATRWGAGHRGVDLLGSVGSAVRAAGPGEVTYAGVLAGRGVVVVRHGALRTTYEPVSAVLPVGTRVGAGAVIGTLDSGHGGLPPPNALLHWGLLRGETYLDPLRLLRRSPARLVPVAPAPAADAPPRAPVPHAAPSVAGRSETVGPERGGRPAAVPLAASAMAATVAGTAVRGGVRRRRSRGP